MDKGEEILDSILLTCKKYEISSATFYGLEVCGEAVIGTYIPEKHDFLLHTKEGMLELVSLMGNVTQNTEIHAHAMFSYFDSESKDIKYFGEDLKEGDVLYTGEITIDPVKDGQISKVFNSNIGIDVWDFQEK
ncbi:DUF296 domain-containing protein [Limosilactobacillus reuteri]|uniref:PPC domain-containing DNA-binding protein n=1 Tax=Limosilactobacillus reuteri TaxID=1598 RepID=UPI002B4BD718|nr:DUF296 domain-containing protein [Limosilactobacillus reuteri]MCC4337293.1 DUF296 domain-containing protein [Limosilactobacillus reuteri]